MAVLSTWGDYSTYTDAAGKYRVIWQTDAGQIIFHKFDSEPTLPFMEKFFDRMRSDWDGTVQLVRYDEEDEITLRDAIAYIRPRPTLNLTQWNAYLNTLTYEKKSIVKAFIHKLAIQLAAHYGVVLDNFTETEILAKTRNWICNVQLNILKRVCFGYLISM